MTSEINNKDSRVEEIYQSMRIRMIQFDTNPWLNDVRTRMLVWIQELANQRGKGLHYLGMPSVMFYDVKDWLTYLGEVSSVELMTDIYTKQAISGPKLGIPYNGYLGDIDYVIHNAKDYNERKLEGPFDLVFLDYWEDIFYQKVNRLHTASSLAAQQYLCGQKEWIFALSHRVEEKNEDAYFALTSQINETERVQFDDSQLQHAYSVIWNMKKAFVEKGYRSAGIELYMYAQRLHYVFKLEHMLQSDPVNPLMSDLRVWKEGNEQELFVELDISKGELHGKSN
ncbi:hypothetical protein [Paenibacillus wynnii]|uniref:hypothetical protein n=1 Tax=Paenibacillus wynnii TaxID=268407 RepID=UPI002792B556|nr:hypothetical protein [Paenibacillus wynnii]MDQ0193747.1 hypothetical protein [Paenibacillus wynnii]